MSTSRSSTAWHRQLRKASSDMQALRSGANSPQVNTELIVNTPRLAACSHTPAASSR